MTSHTSHTSAHKPALVDRYSRRLFKVEKLHCAMNECESVEMKCNKVSADAKITIKLDVMTVSVFSRAREDGWSRYTRDSYQTMRFFQQVTSARRCREAQVAVAAGIPNTYSYQLGSMNMHLKNE